MSGPGVNKIGQQGGVGGYERVLLLPHKNLIATSFLYYFLLAISTFLLLCFLDWSNPWLYVALAIFASLSVCVLLLGAILVFELPAAYDVMLSKEYFESRFFFIRKQIPMHSVSKFEIRPCYWEGSVSYRIHAVEQANATENQSLLSINALAYCGRDPDPDRNTQSLCDWLNFALNSRQNFSALGLVSAAPPNINVRSL